MRLQIKVFGEDTEDNLGYRYWAVASFNSVHVAQEESKISYQEALGKLVVSLQGEFSEFALDLSEFGK